MSLQTLISEVEDLVISRKGGAGSGNRGHAGIPGHRGGSAAGMGSGGATFRGEPTLAPKITNQLGDYHIEHGPPTTKNDSGFRWGISIHPTKLEEFKSQKVGTKTKFIGGMRDRWEVTRTKKGLAFDNAIDKGVAHQTFEVKFSDFEGILK